MKDKYLAKRNELLNQAEALINEGKIDESASIRRQIEELDNEYENKKIEMANLAKLKDEGKMPNLSNASVNPTNTKVVDSIVATNEDDVTVYENAFAKTLLGKTLSDEESVVFENATARFANEYTHDTGNTAVMLPESWALGIWSRAEEDSPLLADVTKFNVKGTFSMRKHDAIKSGDASFIDEDTLIPDEENEFGVFTLNGHELAKSVTISWKLRSMSVVEFKDYLIKELAARVGTVRAKAIYSGTGVKQSTGIKTVLNKEDKKPQVTEYETGKMKYEDITKLLSKLHSVYTKKSKIYVSNDTLWNVLANIVDGIGRPLFVPDPTGDVAGRVLGRVVEVDSAIDEGDVLVGDASMYYENTNEPLSIATEDHVKPRKTDYAAYTIVDGNVVDNKAFAILTPKLGTK